MRLISFKEDPSHASSVDGPVCLLPRILEIDFREQLYHKPASCICFRFNSPRGTINLAAADLIEVMLKRDPQNRFLS